jgi:hypothetical protein
MLRLQPVMLGPPPGAQAGGVSAEDDLDPAELRPKGRAGRMAAFAAAALVLATAGAAYMVLRSREPLMVDAPAADKPPATTLAAPDRPPTNQQSQTPEAARQVPPVDAAPQQAAPAQPPAQAPGASAGLDMGSIESDLVPPSTEGLSPARRIQTIVIRVENDRELPALR